MFQDLSDEEKTEIRRGLEHSASGLILRNWLEVRELFIKYLYTSLDSPYYPTDAIFSRDEYQSDTGNLPHMHMMVALDSSVMSPSQKEKIYDLIRASVCDIIRYNEVTTLINDDAI